MPPHTGNGGKCPRPVFTRRARANTRPSGGTPPMRGLLMACGHGSVYRDFTLLPTHQKLRLLQADLPHRPPTGRAFPALPGAGHKPPCPLQGQCRAGSRRVFRATRGMVRGYPAYHSGHEKNFPSKRKVFFLKKRIFFCALAAVRHIRKDTQYLSKKTKYFGELSASICIFLVGISLAVRFADFRCIPMLSACLRW